MKATRLLIAATGLVLMSFATTTSLVWKSDVIETGNIPQGTPKTVEFVLTNTGAKEVLITNVRPGCGCTAADYTKEAIKPGANGVVKATYNAANAGAFTKTVTVTTTADETPKVLTIKGVVVAKQ